MSYQTIQDNISNKTLQVVELNNSIKLFTSQIRDLYLFTINYKTAPVVLREKVAIPEYLLPDCYKLFKEFKSIKSFLILSTCNRTEIYFTSDLLKDALKDIYSFFAKQLHIEEKVVKEYNNLTSAQDVVNHTFRLACGLDSLVLGERQILSQLKNAYSTSQKERTLDNTLEVLFQNTIKTSKEAHKKTNLSNDSQSISSAAIDLANGICGPLKTKKIMILGAGKMAKLALEHIIKVGGSEETVVLNKSPHRVIEFAEKYQVDKSIPFDSVYETINDVDVVIAATGAPHFILFAEQFKTIRKDTNKELFMFDISMPRNIDSEFGKLPNIKLFDIDNLQATYRENTIVNKEAVNKVESIIVNGISRFYTQTSNKEVSLLIKNLKQEFENVRLTKLKKLTNKATYTREEVDYITKNVINTILHKPIKNLKSSNPNGSLESKSELVKELFGLKI